MAVALLSLLFVALQLHSTFACPEGDGHDVHDHVHERRATAPTPPVAPTVPLVWGDLNVIHTTDTHGWLLGHQKATPPEPNYNGNLGDFSSFVSHMQEIALEKNVDLLLVDSGDLHDGTGLSDGFPAGGIDAHDSDKFMTMLPFDLLTIGNHELSDGYNTALDVFQNFASFWGDKYLTSNVNITIANARGKPVSVPIGQRFRKFKTRLGRQITSLGVLYDFTGNADNTTVQFVEDMVTEEWFAEAIKDEPDLFLLIGHIPVSRDKWPVVFDAIRAVHNDTPILIFGGHSHIRDCLQFDGRSMSLESGRYMETIGWMSVDLDDRNERSTKNLTFSRRYLDQNVPTYEFHTNRNQKDFHTAQGQSITQGMNNLAAQFDLNFTFGTAPTDFFVNRVPATANNSLLNLLINEAAPIALAINNTRANISNVIFSNSGEVRYDLFAGTFNKNDGIVALPFADAFLFIPGVPVSIASQVLNELNGGSSDEKRKRAQTGMKEREEELYRKGNVDKRFNDWLEDMTRRAYAIQKRQTENLTLGYATTDSCPGIGDDVPHTPVPHFSTPDFIGSNPPAGAAPTDLIDLVFINFIESDILDALKKIPGGANFTEADISSYTSILANQIFGLFAQEVWN